MRRLAFASLAAALACGPGGEPAPPPSPRSLEEGVVARVGRSGVVRGSVVRQIAQTQGVTLSEARDRAVRDALFAAEAEARGLDVAGETTALLARVLFDRLRAEVSGPVTDVELEQVTERHWLDLRRPPARRVIHAVVQVSKPKAGDAATWAAAEAVAQKIHAATAAASETSRAWSPTLEDPSLAAFRRAASEVDGGGLEVRVEVLEPFIADGRVTTRSGQRYVPEFSAAVFALQRRGDRTEPFRSPFGVHVALLLEVLPPREVPPEERRRLVRAEVIDDRLRARRREILEASSGSVEIASNADSLLGLVQVR